MAFTLQEIEPATPVKRNGIQLRPPSHTQPAMDALPYVGMIGVAIYELETFDPVEGLEDTLADMRKHMPYTKVTGAYPKYVLAVLAPGSDEAQGLAALEHLQPNHSNDPAIRRGWANQTVGDLLRAEPELVLIVLHSTNGKDWQRRVYRLAA